MAPSKPVPVAQTPVAPVYIFVDKNEFETLKATVQTLLNPAPVKLQVVPQSPLFSAIVLLAIGAIAASQATDPKLSVLVYFIGVVLAQACIDLYAGKNKPKWSAAFRVLALAVWYVAQLIPK